ncbi:hypothetical protein FVE85_5247 [Porphyridium purpureum]|uniref:Uncharacterized protein n=1 Tax=Porphyridium purpureum TaxID=35688 RepID=A0A5J4Z389_PORPP|nr:hypothetical protein FVE85_5247 [Porphyridium purpureum]|eukprot:POR3377..scf295_1
MAIKKGEVPSKSELNQMIAAELKEFLETNGVELSSVPSTGKTPNRPTRKDLFTRASELREELQSTKDSRKDGAQPRNDATPRANGKATDLSEPVDLLKSPTSARGRRSSGRRSSARLAPEDSIEPERPPTDTSSDEVDEDDEEEEEQDETEKVVAVVIPRASRVQMVVLVVFNMLLLLCLIGALLSLRGSLSYLSGSSK